MIATKPTQDKMMKTVYCLYRVSTKGQVDKNWTIVNKVDRKNRKIK